MRQNKNNIVNKSRYLFKKLIGKHKENWKKQIFKKLQRKIKYNSRKLRKNRYSILIYPQNFENLDEMDNF